MNRFKVNLKNFKNYVKENFDMSIYQIRLKYKHSIKVAKISRKLARKIGVSEWLSFNIGLLHDFARFEQFTKYKTFVDLKSVDHGALACEILFERGHIEKFNLNEKEKFILKLAVFYHNKIAVDETAVKIEVASSGFDLDCNEVIEFCHLIRDTDKIDIFRVILQTNFSFGGEGDGVSKEIKNSVENFIAPDFKFRKTKLDLLLVDLSFLYGIYFKESFALFNYKKFLKRFKEKYYNFLNSEDKKYFSYYLEVLKTKLENDLK